MLVLWGLPANLSGYDMMYPRTEFKKTLKNPTALW